MMPAYKDKKRGTWYFSCYPPKGYPGRRNKKLLRGYKTKREALKGEREWLNECERITAGDVYLKEVIDHMLRFKESPRSTVVSVNSYYSSHYSKFFDTVYMRDITEDDILEFKDYLKKSGLKESTNRTILATLRSIFEHGVIHFSLDTNPVKRIKAFRRTKPKNNYIKFEELYKRVADMPNETYRQFTIFLMNTGLRIGEARAVTWRDVDFVNRTIDINKKLTQFSEDMEYFTKTDSSSAKIPFPDIVYDILVSIRDEQYMYYKYINEDYFAFGGMSSINYHNYRYAFKTVFPELTLHDLRHSYASHLYSKGTDYNTLKELLRHATISTTINTYTHNYDESTKSAMESLDKYK